MVEADSHHNLLPTSILDIYKVFEHNDMLPMGIQQQPYTDTHTTPRQRGQPRQDNEDNVRTTTAGEPSSRPAAGGAINKGWRP